MYLLIHLSVSETWTYNVFGDLNKKYFVQNTKLDGYLFMKYFDALI